MKTKLIVPIIVFSILFGTFAYANEPPSWSWWKLDETSGATAYDSAGMNDATVHGAVWVPGKIGGALDFDGSGDYVDVGNAVGSGAYTKIAWVKRQAGDYYNNIISSGDTTSHAIYAPYHQGFRLSAGHSNPYTQVQDPQPLNVDQWYFVAVTFDPAVGSGRMILYKDGEIVDSADSISTQSASLKTTIGSFNGSYFLKGSIDDARVYNSALSPQEIRQIYTESALKNWWTLDEAAGTTAFDSYSTNNGTIYGGPDRTTGKIGGALNFDGSDDYVSLSPSVVSSYTKAAWVRLESSAQTYSHNILSGAPGHAFWAPNTYGNKLSAGHNYVWNQVQDPNALQMGKWYFVAVTYDANSNVLVLYKNGEQVSTGSTTAPQPLTQFNIGRYDSSATYFKGDIDNIKLFDRALTANEILEMYQERTLQAYWKFDEGTGTTASDSIGQNNGTIYGASWTTGIIGGALDFDGINDYVDCGNGASNYDNITVSAWMKTDTEGILVSNRGSVGSYGTWYTLFSNRIEIGDNSQGGYRWLDFNTTTLDDEWHHVVYTKTGDSHTVYIDGAVDLQFTAAADISQNAPTLIGRRWTRTYSVFWFNGIIDDVRIYDNALSYEEVWQLYSAPYAMALWKFDEPQGTVAYDSTGNTNNGAFINSPVWTTGIIRGALRFDGINDYVQVPDSAYLDVSSLFSFSFWVYVDPNVPPSGAVISKDQLGYDKTGGYNVYVGYSGVRSVGFEINNRTPELVSGPNTLTPGAWNHVVTTFDSSASPTAKIYINGEMISSGSIPAPSIFATDLLIGRRGHPTDSYYLNTKIDDLRIYNIALKDDEVSLLYQSGL